MRIRGRVGVDGVGSSIMLFKRFYYYFLIQIHYLLSNYYSIFIIVK